MTKGKTPEQEVDFLEELKAELDEAIDARKRALADFANFQRRATDNERRAVADGAARVVRSLLGVIDHFDLALDRGEEKMTVDQLLSGVRIVRDELVTALESHGVERIQPEVGDAFDPNRHEAVLHQAAEGIEPDHIASVLQPGYRMGAVVLRPAKVGVAPPPEAS